MHLVYFRSLESKLEFLKAEGINDSNVGYDSSQTESLVPFQKSDGVESSSKETSKDGLSAGSFTQETRTNWSPECQVPASASVEDVETKPEVPLSPKQEKVSNIATLAEAFCMGQGGSIRRRRGKRKRKSCSKDVKEGSVGESDFWGSTDVLSVARCKENSTSSSGQTGRGFEIDDKSRDLSKDGVAPNLMEIFNSIAENKCASVFRRRLDSQVYIDANLLSEVGFGISIVDGAFCCLFFLATSIFVPLLMYESADFCCFLIFCNRRGEDTRK